MSPGQSFIPCVDKTKIKVDGYSADSKSLVIYYRKTISDIEFKFSTKVRALDRIDQAALFNPKARTVANRFIKEFFEKRNSTLEVKPLLIDIWPELTQRRQKAFESGNLKKGPKYHCENSGKKFLAWWGDKFPEEITTENWELFEDWYARTNGNEGKHNVTKYFKVFVKFLIEKGYLLRQPKVVNRNAKNDRIARKKAKKRLMTPGESEALITVTPWPFNLWMMMLSDLAFRISEPGELTWDRIKFKDDHPEFQKVNPDLDTVNPAISFSEHNNKAGYDVDTPISDRIYWLLKKLYSEQKAQLMGAEPVNVFPQLKDPSKQMQPQYFDRAFKLVKEGVAITWPTSHSFRHFRLTQDFSRTDVSHAQVCILRRVSLKTALEHYIKPDEKSMVRLRRTI